MTILNRGDVVERVYINGRKNLMVFLCTATSIDHGTLSMTECSLFITSQGIEKMLEFEMPTYFYVLHNDDLARYIATKHMNHVGEVIPVSGNLMSENNEVQKFLHEYNFISQRHKVIDVCETVRV